MEFAVNCVKFAIMLIVIAVWAVVGLIFWIPLLIRATSAFSMRVLHGMLTAQPPQGMDVHLEYAAGFYLRGFLAITTIAFAPHQPQATVRPRLAVILVEIAWTVGTWVVVSAALDWGPGRVWFESGRVKAAQALGLNGQAPADLPHLGR